MEKPNVLNIVNDPARKVTYRVMAYRAMTRNELLQAVAMYLKSQKNKQPKAGTVVTIFTITGLHG